MKYITRDEAIAAIEQGFASRDEYDIDAIADALITFDGQHYTVDEAVDFWQIVAENEIGE